MATIEELENDVWPEPEFESHLVTTCHRLRKKAIEEFTPEDFRIMIGQKMALQILMPGAIDVLEKDPFARGDFYPGDLLNSVTTVRSHFFERNPELLAKLVAIVERALDILQLGSTNENLANSLRDFMTRHAQS